MKFTLWLFFLYYISSSLLAQDFPQQIQNNPLVLSGDSRGPFRGGDSLRAPTIIETDTGYMLIQPDESKDPQIKQIYLEAKQRRDAACNTPYYNDLKSTEIKFPSSTHQLKVHENHPFRVAHEQDPLPRQFKTHPSVIVSFENYSAHRPARPKMKMNTLKAARYLPSDDTPTLNGIIVPVDIPDDLGLRVLERIPMSLSRIVRTLNDESEFCLNTPPDKEMVDLEIKVKVSSSDFYSAMKNLVQAHTFKGLLCQAPYAFTFQGIHHEQKANASVDIKFDTTLSRQVCTTKSKRVCESKWVGARITVCGNINVPHIYVEKMPSLDLSANIAIEGDISYKVLGNSRYLPTYEGTIDLVDLRNILSDQGVPYRDSWIKDSNYGPSFTFLYRIDSLPKHDAQILSGIIKAEMNRQSIGAHE